MSVLTAIIIRACGQNAHFMTNAQYMVLLLPRKGDPFQDNEHGDVLTKWLSMQEFVPSSLLFALP